AGFKLYWKWISRRRMSVGRRPTSKELRELILRMLAENRIWGAPRIHGELKILGFDISERTVLRWMRRAPRDPEPAKRWKAFLSNHREAIAAMDFFTVPTLTFGVLYCFFVIAHDRRRILHRNVTRSCFITGSDCVGTIPPGPKPAILLLRTGTAKAVTFQNQVMKQLVAIRR